MSAFDTLHQTSRSLEKTLALLNDEELPQSDRLHFLAIAEKHMQTLRAIVEALPQAQQMEERYGTSEPRSIRDWWMPRP